MTSRQTERFFIDCQKRCTKTPEIQASNIYKFKAAIVQQAAYHTQKQKNTIDMATAGVLGHPAPTLVTPKLVMASS